MNKHIQRLSEQATVAVSYRVCQNTFRHIDDPTGPYVRKEFDKEKFAELIVQECAAVIQAEKDTGLYNVQQQTGMTVSKTIIADHFSVSAGSHE